MYKKIMEILTCKYIDGERGEYKYAIYFAEKENTICTVISKEKLHGGDIVIVKEIDNRENIYECLKILDKNPSSLKKILLSLFSILLMLIFKSYSAVICGDNGAIYDDVNLCSSVCSIPCSKVELKTTVSNGPCDKNNYQGFIFFNNKTYALSINKGFWEDFNNLVVIPDKQTNDLLKGILSYYNKTAWIGLYDPSFSQNFNSVDPDRFIWVDGSPVSYTNWRNGEPNNFIFDDDIGVVSIYGEYWVEMYSDGTWNDEGYHKYFGGDYKPRDYALVEWDGPLDCVNAEVPPDIGSSQTNLTSILCGGTTPCYACTTNGADFQKCDYATDKAGISKYSCPINRKRCTATYENPVCPPGGNFNATTGLCEAKPL